MRYIKRTMYYLPMTSVCRMPHGMVSKDRLHFPYLRKGVTTHSTIDNNNGR